MKSPSQGVHLLCIFIYCVRDNIKILTTETHGSDVNLSSGTNRQTLIYDVYKSFCPDV